MSLRWLVIETGALVALLAGFAHAGEETIGPAPRPPEGELATSIELENLPSCIDEAALEQRVAILVRPERLDSARRVEGIVVEEGEQWIVRFRVFEGDELIGRRRLEFARGACEPFREDVELVLAMLLEGRGFEPPETEAPTEGESTVASAPPPAGPPPPAPAERKPTGHMKGRFRLGGELALGVLPAPSAGLRLEAGVEFASPWALSMRMTWHLDDSLPVEDGGRVDYGGYRLGAMACYLHRRSWVLAGCAGLGFVALAAEGVGVPGAQATSFIHGTAILGARVGVPLTGAWSLEVGAEVEAWFARPEYVLLTGGDPLILWTASGVPVVGWLALGYDF